MEPQARRQATVDKVTGAGKPPVPLAEFDPPWRTLGVMKRWWKRSHAAPVALALRHGLVPQAGEKGRAPSGYRDTLPLRWFRPA